MLVILNTHTLRVNLNCDNSLLNLQLLNCASCIPYTNVMSCIGLTQSMWKGPFEDLRIMNEALNCFNASIFDLVLKLSFIMTHIFCNVIELSLFYKTCFALNAVSIMGLSWHSNFLYQMVFLIHHKFWSVFSNGTQLQWHNILTWYKYYL